MSLFLPDHPRACGANIAFAHVQFHERGSSPRVRGKLLVVGGIVGGVRIIPARAGQTVVSSADQGQYSDHPRACGANHAIARSCGVGNGSSPRVRGKQVVAVLEHAGQRIIPARAGLYFVKSVFRV